MSSPAITIADNHLHLPAAWPESEPFWGRAWLAYYEHAIKQSPRYILVTQAGEPLAAAVCELATRFYVPYLHGAALDLAQRLLTPRVLLCELPSLEQAGIWLHPDPRRQAIAIPALGEALRALAAEARRPLLILTYVDAALHATRAQWRGFAGQTSEDDTRLTLRGGTLDGFLDGLPRSVRQDLRRARRLADRDELHTEQIPLPGSGDAAARELYALLAQVYRHHAEPGIPVRESVYADLALLPGAELFVVRDARGLRACGAMLISGTQATLKLLGLDYRCPAPYLHTLLYLAAIERALARGIEHVWLGTTHVADKVRRFGAARIPRYDWCASRPPYGLLTRLAGYAARDGAPA